MSSQTTLHDISSLPFLSQSDHKQILSTLFEPSHYLHEIGTPLLKEKRYSSYPDLVDAIETRLKGLANSNDNPDDIKVLYDILGSHPRLGQGPASSTTKPEQLSELSKREQANLNVASDIHAQEEAKQLAELNREYEEKFPGLRYVVFVNGRGRDVIMEDMRRRIQRGDVKLEIAEIIQAMCDIAKDRARKLQP